MELRPLKPFGTEIVGVDLSSELDEQTFATIENALNRDGVVVFHDQDLEPEKQIAFTKRFGELEVHVRQEYALQGYPQIHLISNIKEGERTIGSAYAGDDWHTDLCYKKRPARMSLLHAKEVPHDEQGEPLGDTLFVHTGDAYETLPHDIKETIKNLRGVHQYARAQERKRLQREHDHGRAELTEAQKAATPDVTHPMVRTHPITGQKCLYVNQTYTFGIDGWTEADAQPLLKKLFEHIIRPEKRYCHRWRVGDVIMWDNCVTQHKAAGGYRWPQRRLMHRAAVNGSEPF